MTDQELLKSYLADRDVPCPGCNYNLRGLDADKCPECGAPVRFFIESAVLTPRLKQLAIFVAVLFSLLTAYRSWFTAWWLTTLIWGKSLAPASMIAMNVVIGLMSLAALFIFGWTLKLLVIGTHVRKQISALRLLLLGVLLSGIWEALERAPWLWSWIFR